MKMKEIQNIIKKNNKGYMTIEASFILPFILCLIMFLIYFGFYCFDRTVSIQNCYIVALRTSNQWEAGNEQKIEYAIREWQKLSENKLIFLGKRKFEMEIKNQKYTGSFKAEIDNYMDEIIHFGLGEFKISESMEARRVYPAEMIRNYKLWR